MRADSAAVGIGGWFPEQFQLAVVKLLSRQFFFEYVCIDHVCEACVHVQ